MLCRIGRAVEILALQSFALVTEQIPAFLFSQYVTNNSARTGKWTLRAPCGVRSWLYSVARCIWGCTKQSAGGRGYLAEARSKLQDAGVQTYEVRECTPQWPSVSLGYSSRCALYSTSPPSHIAGFPEDAEHVLETSGRKVESSKTCAIGCRF